jgi:hypothetical protein
MTLAIYNLYVTSCPLPPLHLMPAQGEISVISPSPGKSPGALVDQLEAWAGVLAPGLQLCGLGQVLQLL